MNDIIQLNKFAHLHNSKNIFFCKTDYLAQLFLMLKEYNLPSILITGNSDYPITDGILSQLPSCIRKWYAQNAETYNPLVTGIPMGIENHENCILSGYGVGWQHAIEKIKLLSNPPPINITKDLYANFSLDTHPSRHRVYEICKDLDFVTTKVSGQHSQINERSYREYINDILKHKMIVCPRGNGVDCHRVWEVLYLGRVPIIKKEPAMRHFSHLPIIFLDDWSQLREDGRLYQEYNKVKNYSRDMLSFKYWKKRIELEALEIET